MVGFLEAWANWLGGRGRWDGKGGFRNRGSGQSQEHSSDKVLLLGELNPTQAKKQAGKSIPIRFLFATLYQKKYIVL